jgi:hypothetical protein
MGDSCHFSAEVNSCWLKLEQGTRLSILFFMKPRRCGRAIILQKVYPIGFFNSRKNIGIGICTCKNVLIDLESCVGMFCCIILSPKRLHGKLPCHYTYSDWLIWIHSRKLPVPCSFYNPSDVFEDDDQHHGERWIARVSFLATRKIEVNTR